MKKSKLIPDTHSYRGILLYVAGLSLLGLIGFVFGVLNATDPLTQQAAAARAAIDATPQPLVEDDELTGDAAYVLDISAGTTVFAKSGDAQLPLASITKTMVAVLAHEHLEPSQSITITAAALTPEGDSGFVEGEVWRMQDLLDFTLMTSSNDGAAALARAIEAHTGTPIAKLMNAKARELGLGQTYFVNETGLDSSEELGGAYGSARDIARLFAYIYRTAPDVFAATTRQAYTFRNASGKVYEGKNTNQSIPNVPGLVFGKTGFTDLSGGNLGVVFEPEPGHAIAVVVLGSTIDGRFDDVSTLTARVLTRHTDP